MFLSYLAGTLAVFIWALLPVLVKSGFTQLPISFFLLLRFSAATALMMSLMWGLRQEIFKLSWKKHFLFTVILGANYALQSLAIRDLPVSWYIVIFALNPLLALVLMRVKMNRNLLLSLALAAVGVFCFIAKDALSLQGITFTSFLCLLGGMITWVLYTFEAKSLQNILSDSALTLYTQVISLIAVLVLWLVDGTPTVPMNGLTASTWGSLLLSGIGLPAAYYLYLYSLRRTPIFCQMSQYLELLFGLAFSSLLYHEVLSDFKIVGSAFIVLSLYFSSQITNLKQ